MNSNDYLNLSEAARRSPGKPHSATVWRWCRRGIKSRLGHRIHLDHIRVGGRIFVPATALENFFQEVAAADAEHFTEQPQTVTAKARTNNQRERSIASAEAVLQRGGIL